MCARCAVRDDDDGEPPRSLLRTRAGQWLVAHGSRFGDEIAIVLEKAATSRERDVALLLARGLSNEAIAAHLAITVHTVKDHVKALFAKSGTETRAELVARVFVDYPPLEGGGAA